MTTIRIQPPMIDVPKGGDCRTYAHTACKFLDRFDGCPIFKVKKLESTHCCKTVIHKCPACLTACAEAERKKKEKE